MSLWSSAFHRELVVALYITSGCSVVLLEKFSWAVGCSARREGG
jgi:hypothetical protein